MSAAPFVPQSEVEPAKPAKSERQIKLEAALARLSSSAELSQEIEAFKMNRDNLLKICKLVDKTHTDSKCFDHSLFNRKTSGKTLSELSKAYALNSKKDWQKNSGKPYNNHHGGKYHERGDRDDRRDHNRHYNHEGGDSGFNRRPDDELTKKLKQQAQQQIDAARQEKGSAQKVCLWLNQISPDNIQKKQFELRGLMFGDRIAEGEPGFDKQGSEFEVD